MKKFALIIVAAYILLFIIVGTLSGSGGGKNSSGCTICGKSASHTFQGSRYCDTHYNNAVKWAIDNVAEND